MKSTFRRQCEYVHAENNSHVAYMQMECVVHFTAYTVHYTYHLIASLIPPLLETPNHNPNSHIKISVRSSAHEIMHAIFIDATRFTAFPITILVDWSPQRRNFHSLGCALHNLLQSHHFVLSTGNSWNLAFEIQFPNIYVFILIFERLIMQKNICRNIQRAAITIYFAFFFASFRFFLFFFPFWFAFGSFGSHFNINGLMGKNDDKQTVMTQFMNVTI